MIKKTFFLILFFQIIYYCPVMADSYDSYDSYQILEEYSGEVDQFLIRNDASKLKISDFIEHIKDGDIKQALLVVKEYIYENVVGDICSVEKNIINLFIVILVSAFYTNISSAFSNNGVSSTGFYICYMIVVLMLVSIFDVTCKMLCRFIKLILGFVLIMAPTYFVSIAIMGQATALGFYQLTVALISVVEFIFLTVSVPLCKIYLVISLVNNLSMDDFLSKTSQLIFNVTSYINKILITLITGLNIIQGLLLPSIDNVKNVSVNKIISVMPYVGNGANAISSIVFSSANLIKNTIGTYVIVIICIFCAIPYIKMVIYSFSTQCLNALVQPIADKRIINSISCFDKAIKMLIKILLSVSGLFIICIGIAALMSNRR